MRPVPRLATPVMVFLTLPLFMYNLKAYTLFLSVPDVAL